MYSDFLLVNQFFSWTVKTFTVQDFNDSLVQDRTTFFFDNFTTKSCKLTHSNQTDGLYTFECQEQNYWFGVVTLIFIYLPSFNVLSAFYGPPIAGAVGVVYGMLMVFLSVLSIAISAIAYLGMLPEMIGWPFLIVGLCLTFLSKAKVRGNCSLLRENLGLLHFLFFPVVFIFSPVLFLSIKAFTILRPNDEMIKSQAKVVTQGETILESTPQLILQLYIVMSMWNATGAQWFSITTSAFSFCTGNLILFLEKRNKSGLKNIVIYFPLFFMTSIFKVMSLAIFVTFTQLWSLLGLCCTLPIVRIFGKPFLRRYKFDGDSNTNIINYSFNLHWLTFSPLSKSGHSTRGITLLTYYFFVIYTMFLIVIALICNISPASVTIPGVSGSIIWADLEIVRNITYLNIIVVTTIGVGALAFVVDYFLYKSRGRVIHENFEKFKNPVRGYLAAKKLTPMEWKEL